MKMQNVQKGFTLIELMIVIAIVGILAAIALPAYQDYTVRAKMAEPMAYLAEAKTTLSEFYATQGVFPTPAQAGLNTSPNTEIVASIKYQVGGTAANAGRVGVLLKANVLPDAVTTYGFSLSPVTVSGSRALQWVCGTTSQAAGITTPVPSKYLPSTCRG